MVDSKQYRVLMVMAVASLLLVVTNIFLLNGNQQLRAQVSERNLYIQQSLQLEGIYQPLLRALAELSVEHDDAQLRDLLSSQGITVELTAADPGAAEEAEPVRQRRASRDGEVTP